MAAAPPAPTFTRFTPTSGAVGSTITLTGSGFTGASSVAFHGTLASSFTVVSDSQLTAVVPQGATSGPISVTTPGGSATSSGSFTVTPTPPPPPPTTTTTTAYYGGGIAESVNGTLSYLLSDPVLGSASASVSTTTGLVTATQLYAPYGSVRYSSGILPTDFGFTHQRAEASRCYQWLDDDGARCTHSASLALSASQEYHRPHHRTADCSGRGRRSGVVGSPVASCAVVLMQRVGVNHGSISRLNIGSRFPHTRVGVNRAFLSSGRPRPLSSPPTCGVGQRLRHCAPGGGSLEALHACHSRPAWGARSANERLSEEGEERAMSLSIVIKGPEGLVLAAESRVTLTVQSPTGHLPGLSGALPTLGIGGAQTLSVSFDHATKLLAFSAPHTYVGAVTFGQAIIGLSQPRTPASFIPELEASLPQQRVPVAEFAQLLSDFYLQQWQERMPPPAAPATPSSSPSSPTSPASPAASPDATFVVGGFDEGAAYGRIFQFAIPSAPTPVEQNADPAFGVLWGGQQEIVDRLLRGYDPSLPMLAAAALQLDPEQVVALQERLGALQLALPINFFALQDCVDLATLLIRTTIAVQQLTISVRGVGGAIDVATITRQEGLQFVQRKRIVGEDAERAW